LYLVRPRRVRPSPRDSDGGRCGAVCQHGVEFRQRERLQAPTRGSHVVGSRVVYGGLNVTAGALVLSGAIHPAGGVDRTALRWHVAVWDLWFPVWGMLLAIATVCYRRQAANPESP
jgi:hypothetical protein